MNDNLDDIEIAEAFGEIPNADTQPMTFDDDFDESGMPVQEVYGSPKNIAEHGSPTESPDAHLRYYFYPTWRSQIGPLFIYFILCVLAVKGSFYIEVTVIQGKLFDAWGKTYNLNLPLLALLPGLMLGKILIYMYDAKYIIDERGVEAQIGLVSLQLRQPRLRFEDIRGVEPIQTIWERILGIGSVAVGSAMTQDIEIIMEGVANPRAIQLLIGGERDKRLKSLQADGGFVAKQNAVFGD